MSNTSYQYLLYPLPKITLSAVHSVKTEDCILLYRYTILFASFMHFMCGLHRDIIGILSDINHRDAGKIVRDNIRFINLIINY